jgi:hypothetical protein
VGLHDDPDTDPASRQSSNSRVDVYVHFDPLVVTTEGPIEVDVTVIVPQPVVAGIKIVPGTPVHNEKE